MTPSDHFKALTRLSNAELEKLLQASAGPSAEALAGSEYAGYNVPWWASVLGIRKFIKGFFKGPRGVEGYNIPVRQNGLHKPWLHRPSPDTPKRFGFFRAAPVDPRGADNLYPKALLLDYGASSRNAFYRVEKVLRDYVVLPDPKNSALLLGKAYVALGPKRAGTSFFVIERLRSTSWKG